MSLQYSFLPGCGTRGPHPTINDMKKPIIFWILSLLALPGLTVAQSTTPDPMLLLSMGRDDEAKALLRRQAQQQPSGDTYFKAGYGYLRAGQPDSARRWFEQGLSRDDKRAPLNQLGLALTQLVQQPGSADGQLAELVKRTRGKNAEILYRIGEAYTGYLTTTEGLIKPLYPRAADPAKAIDYLNRAAEREKKSTDTRASILLALGDAHYLQRQAGQAVSNYESALELGLNPARVYQRIGDIYWQGKNFNLAVENYKKALEATPDYAPAYSQLAELYFRVNRYKEAARYFDQYLSASQDTRPEMRLRQAQFHFLASNFDRAVALIDSNEATLASNPIVYRIRGWAYSSLKEPQKAIDNLNQFFEKAPEKIMPDDYKYLGKAYLALESPGSDSLKVQQDSVGIAYLAKAAPFDTTENLYSDIAKFYYRNKQHSQAVAALDSAARHGFKADVQDLFRYGMSNYTLGFGRDSTGKLVRDTLRFARADSALALAQQGAPDYVPTVLYRAKANYYAYTPEEAVRRGDARPHFEQFIAMVADKEEERNRYKNDLALALKYLISYHEFVSKDSQARQRWIEQGLKLLPGNKDLTKIATAPPGEGTR